MSPRWRPWNPPDAYEEDYYFLEEALSELAGEYRAVPILAALEEGVTTPYVCDGTGDLHPRVLLVGEAPGEDEDEQGEPFVGASGQLLNDLLAELDILRARCYATNLVKARPVNASGRNRAPTPEEAAAAAPFLLREVDLIDAPIVVTLGNVATRALWPDAPGVTTCHGTPRVLPDGRVHLPAVHPSYALRSDEGRRMLRHDVAMLAQLVAATRVVIVTGSRECTRPHDVHTVLAGELRENGPFTLRHGACPRGVDRFADDWGRAHPDRVILDPMPADWDGPLRKGAGLARNQAMVDRGAERCHAFVWNDSAGATHCADRAEAAGIEPVRHRVISNFAGTYAFLSNFYASDLRWDGETWPTAEHAFQGAKTFDSVAREEIRTAFGPREAKKLGRAVALRPDWERVKAGIMFDIVLAKFQGNSGLRDRLLATGDAHLEEANDWGDMTWGTVNGQGQNWLGEILMAVRDALREAVASASSEPVKMSPAEALFGPALRSRPPVDWSFIAADPPRGTR